MQLTQPKWKMVSFRLSAEEYAESLQLCQASGHSSMSRFALCAMRSFAPPAVERQAGSNVRLTQMDDLRRRLDELAAEVKLLSETVGRQK